MEQRMSEKSESMPRQLIPRAFKYLETKQISEAIETRELIWSKLGLPEEITPTYIRFFINTVDLGRKLGINAGDEERALSLLQTLENSPGRENDVAKITWLLARLYLTTEQFGKAEPRCKTALELYRKTNIQQDDVLTIQRLLANILLFKGRVQEAFNISRTEMAARKRLYPNAEKTAGSICNHGFILQHFDLQGAAALQIEALELANRNGYKVQALNIRFDHYITLLKQGQLEGLDLDVEGLITDMEQQNGVLPDIISRAKGLLFMVYCRQGNFTKCTAFCGKEMDVYQKEGQDEEYFETMSRLGFAMMQNEDLDQGGKHAQVALDWMRENLGDTHVKTLKAAFHLVVLPITRADYERAGWECICILEHQVTTLGLNHPDTVATQQTIDMILSLRDKK
ncbi:hypothetical protein BGZ63DRAFT_379429 [Mariannaea sp. PMI_226]|nr:hypothetical protein BGZ63DRAFT_379429 [Mariannaea sp. PMI_226]